MGIELYLASINIWAAIALVVGFSLIIVEMFIPGFGLPGITGVILLIAAIVLQARSFMEAVLLALAIIVLLVLLFLVFMRSASKGRLSRSSIILNNAARREEGYSATEVRHDLLGQAGSVVTALRPVGTAQIGDELFNVVSELDYIESGERVIVTQVAGTRVVVRKTEA